MRPPDARPGFRIVCEICEGLGIVFDGTEDAPATTRSGVGIVARRAEPLASSATSPLQGNMISSRSESAGGKGK